MANFYTQETFQHWMQSQPPTIGLALAVRASLRALPLNTPLLRRAPKEIAQSVILPEFISVAPAWFLGTWPNQADKIRTAATYLSSSEPSLSAIGYIETKSNGTGEDARIQIASTSVAQSTVGALSAAQIAILNDSAVNVSQRSLIDYAAGSSVHSAAHAASRVGSGLAEKYWNEARNDAGLIETGQSGGTLMRRPLWANLIDREVSELWSQMQRILLGLDKNWEVWTQWYDDRLFGNDDRRGRPLFVDLERDRIQTSADEHWENGPDLVNAKLAELERRYRGPSTNVHSPDADVSEYGHFVFLSYKCENEPAARAIHDALAIAGIPVWWDRDIPAEVNFRTHVAAQLEKAGCVLTLWSKDGLHSDWLHDEAERGRQRRRLVQGTLDGTMPLPPFSSRQVTDLSDWNGDPHAPEFQKILAGILSCFGKVDSPEDRAEALRAGVQQRSRIAAKEKDRRVHLTQTPPDIRKPIERSRNAQIEVLEQIALVKIAIEEVAVSASNLDKHKLLRQLKRYLGALEAEDPDYIVVRPAWLPLGANLSDEDLLGAAGSDLIETFEALTKGHEAVVKAVYKVRGDRNEEQIDLENSVGPNVNEEELDAPEIQEAIQKAAEIVSSNDASEFLDDTASAVVSLGVEQYIEGKDSQDDTRPEVKRRGKKWMANSVVQVAGAAIAISASLATIAQFAGIPNAVALITKLEGVIAVLLRVFS